MTPLEKQLLKALKEILAEANRPTDPALKCGVIKLAAIEAIQEANWHMTDDELAESQGGE